jgi:hypothetical protein
MNPRLLFVPFLFFATAAFAADQPKPGTPKLPPVPASPIAEKKELLFSDDFENAKGDPRWKIAVPTFTRVDGMLKGTQTRDKDVPAADGKPEIKAHPAVISLVVPTKDCVVEVKIKFGGNTVMDVEWDDRAFTGSHYGHLCRAQAKLNGFNLLDERDGSQSNELIELKKDPVKNKAAIGKLYATHSVLYPGKLDPDKWYLYGVEIANDEMRVTVDGKPVAYLKSPGIAHATKSQLEFGVSGKDGYFDDLKVWNAVPAAAK